MPFVAPITVLIAVLLVIVAALDRLVPVAVATIPATAAVPVLPAETILMGTVIELLAVAMFIL